MRSIKVPISMVIQHSRRSQEFTARIECAIREHELGLRRGRLGMRPQKAHQRLDWAGGRKHGIVVQQKDEFPSAPHKPKIVPPRIAKILSGTHHLDGLFGQIQRRSRTIVHNNRLRLWQKRAHGPNTFRQALRLVPRNDQDGKLYFIQHGRSISQATKTPTHHDRPITISELQDSWSFAIVNPVMQRVTSMKGLRLSLLPLLGGRPWRAFRLG